MSLFIAAIVCDMKRIETTKVSITIIWLNQRIVYPKNEPLQHYEKKILCNDIDMTSDYTINEKKIRDRQYV